VIIHLSVWISYLVLLIWLYSETKGNEPYVTRSIFIISVQVVLFYFNFHVLLPKFFENKKYLHYGLAVAGTLVISILLFVIFDRIMLDLELRKALEANDFSRLPREFRGRGRHIPRGPWASPLKYILWRSVLFYGFFVVMSLFISTIYRNLVVNQRKENEALQLISQVREAESNLLKSQINPHFLFNTLNNIYSMAQLKSEQTADAVHRLSEMLRYVIYECNQPRVKLGQEVSYIKSYIELQMLKDEQTQHIRYSLESADAALMIAPMLLIPFIENGFKHSYIEDTEKSWINIELKTKGSTLSMKVNNSIPPRSGTKDATGGVGLENVQKRLSILYPDRHQLIIEKDLAEFKVELNLELDEN
jgi:hypothetical protein